MKNISDSLDDLQSNIKSLDAKLQQIINRLEEPNICPSCGNGEMRASSYQPTFECSKCDYLEVQ